MGDESDKPGAVGSADGFADRIVAEMPGLCRYATYLVANRIEAEEVVGETVMRALERQDQFRGDASLRTWLHQILHHLAVDRARHLSHEIAVESIEDLWDDERYSVDAAAVVERSETRAELEEALLHLPASYRSVVVLHDAEAWSVREIAALLGIGLPAAKQRLRRGRMTLVTLLAQGKEREAANRNVVLLCTSARRQVSDYIDGRLDRGHSDALEAHLSECATCPPLFQALVGVTASLGTFRDGDNVISADLAQRVRMALDNRSPR